MCSPGISLFAFTGVNLKHTTLYSKDNGVCILSFHSQSLEIYLAMLTSQMMTSLVC